MTVSSPSSTLEPSAPAAPGTPSASAATSDRSRAVFHASPAGLLVIDARGTVVDANSAALAALRHTRSSLLGRPVNDLVPERLRERHRQLIAGFVSHPTSRQMGPGRELVALRGDGSECLVDISLAPMDGPSGVEVVACLCDVTERERNQQALENSESRWRSMANGLPQLVWTCGRDGRCDFLSQQWINYTGRPEAEQLGLGWLEHVHPDDQEALMQRWSNAVQSLSAFEVEFRLRRHDGVYRWFDTRAEPVLDEAGQLVRWVGSNTDIEHRKQTEAEVQRLNTELAQKNAMQAATLRQRERDLKALLDHTPAMMGYWDHHLCNRFANHAYRDWFGIDPETVPGRHISEILTPQVLQANEPYIAGVLAGQPQHFERVIPRPDGQGVRYGQTAYIPDFDERGRVQGFYVTVSDVTELHEAQARESEWSRLASAVITHSPIGIGVFHPDGPCVLSNPALRRLLDGGSDRMAELSLVTLSGQQPCLQACVAATLMDGRPREVEIDTVSPLSGEPVHATVNAARVDRDGLPHIMLLAQDTSPQQRAHDELVRARDAARDAARAKSAFLANMSHEIRTPMNAIVGLTRLVLNDPLPPRAAEYLMKVQQSAAALMGILDDVLDHSKIEAGLMRIEWEPVDLREVLQRVRDLFAGHVQHKGLELNLSMAPDAPARLISDALRLSQVLNNLVGNAVKFTEHGRIDVTVQPLGQTTDGDTILRFAVRDTGIGIPPPQRQRLFEPFAQADSSITRRFGGTGLGLTICRSLVHMMGGSIGVDSTEGRGSEFWFVLPLRSAPAVAHPVPSRWPADAEPAPATPPTVHAPLPDWPNRRLLLAEDNRLNQIVAQEFLGAMGFVVDTVDDGAAALEAIRQQPVGHYAAVLMDVHMPVMDGLQATRLIRSQPGRSDLPIIAMTAAAMPSDREQCRLAGMVDHIAKPITPEAIQHVLARWLLPGGREGDAALDETASPPVPPLDLGTLKRQLAGNEHLLWAVLRQFAIQEAQTLEVLTSLLDRQDWSAARQRVHSLKGCVANLGLPRLFEACASLDSALRQGHHDPTAWAALQATLGEALAQVHALLDEHDGARGAPPGPGEGAPTGGSALGLQLGEGRGHGR